MSARIFISFASKDVKVAQTLCSALENRGLPCWISARDIQPGENFQVSIVQALRHAKIMLLVFTANSNASEEMTKELALASQLKLIVIPLRVEDVTPSDAFTYEFATRQWIDVFADWETSIDQLCRRITRALEGDGAETLAPVEIADQAQVEEAKALLAEVAAVDDAALTLIAETPPPPAEAPHAELAEVAADGERGKFARIALLAAALVLVVGMGIAAPILLGKAKPAAPAAASQPAGLITAANAGPPAATTDAAPLAAVALTEPVAPTKVKRKAPRREAETDIPY
jgi:hypothetical protein